MSRRRVEVLREGVSIITSTIITIPLPWRLPIQLILWLRLPEKVRNLRIRTTTNAIETRSKISAQIIFTRPSLSHRRLWTRKSKEPMNKPPKRF